VAGEVGAKRLAAVEVEAKGLNETEDLVALELLDSGRQQSAVEKPMKYLSGWKAWIGPLTLVAGVGGHHYT
jgi:hypothetical protein